jgi:hypothetical protein
VSASTEKVTIWPYQKRWFIKVGDEERRPVSEEEPIAILREVAAKATA